MAKFHLLAPARGEHKASAVFLHGLGGDPYETWTSLGAESAVWPAWLAEQIDGLSVHLVGYDAPASGWQGRGMHPVDHATAILNGLYIEPALATNDLFLIGHSLGGLIIKMMMRRAESEEKGRAEAQSFLQRVRKVAFLATPHTGTDLAQIGKALRVLARPSAATEALARNDPYLRELTEGYRKVARDRAVEHLILTERLPLILKGKKWGVIPYRISLGVIVKPDSADPGLAVDPIPIAVDHIQIAKPKDQGDEIYLHLRAFLGRPATAAPVDPAVPAIHKAAEENARLHDRTFEVTQALREEIAREKGVPPQVLKPLFEKLGAMNLSLDEMRDKAEWAISEILAQSVESRPQSNLGGDLDDVIAKARKLLHELRTADALQLLQQQDAAEIEEAKQQARRTIERRLVLLHETVRIQKAIFDYGAAKTTLREMARLDDGNGWALVELGDLERISGTIEAALAAYEAALAIARSSKGEQNIGAVLDRIGDVLLSRNDLEGALKNYQEGLEIRRRLMAADPSHAERARDVSVSLSKLASVPLMQGKQQIGCSHLTEARNIIAGLAEKAPDVHVYKSDLAWLDEMIAEHCGG